MIYIENKVAKNTGLMYRAKEFLGKNSLVALFYWYIFTHIQIMQIYRGAVQTKLKKLFSQQNHALQIIKGTVMQII